jgi:hypothetical protein
MKDSTSKNPQQQPHNKYQTNTYIEEESIEEEEQLYYPQGPIPVGKKNG